MYAGNGGGNIHKIQQCDQDKEKHQSDAPADPVEPPECERSGNKKIE